METLALNDKLLTDASDIDKLQAINDMLGGMASYELAPTQLSGTTLKLIYSFYKALGIDLERLLPISKAGLYRQFKQEDVDLSLKDSLVSIVRVVNKGIHTFVVWEHFQEWLFSRVENLKGMRPIDLLALQTGRREVEQTLDRIEYGVYG